MRPTSCGTKLGSPLLFGRRLASQLRQLSLLLRRQFVFDSHEQCHLLSLDFAFRRQYPFQLRKNLLLVHARLLDERYQLFHFILQLPLQLGELQLRLADFRLQILFLLRAQPDCFLMLNHEFWSKETLPDRILIGLLGTGRSHRQKKHGTKAENPGSHFTPPHFFSPEHSDTTRRVSASSAKSLAPAPPAEHRWELAILLASERPRVRLPGSFALPGGRSSPQSSPPQLPR